MLTGSHEFIVNSNPNSITYNIEITVKGNSVGIIKINGFGSALMSLARLDVIEEERHKGYGSLLMDKFIDSCAEHCASFNIWVDRKRSNEDDPLLFYKKYFAARHLQYTQGRDFGAIFFASQACISVTIKDILTARFENEFENSKLTPPQFLAMKLYNLPEANVRQSWFVREHFLALKKGLNYSDIEEVAPETIEFVLTGKNIPSLSLLRHLTKTHLSILKMLKQADLESKITYEILITFDVSLLEQWHTRRWKDIMAKKYFSTISFGDFSLEITQLRFELLMGPYQKRASLDSSSYQGLNMTFFNEAKLYVPTPYTRYEPEPNMKNTPIMQSLTELLTTQIKKLTKANNCNIVNLGQSEYGVFFHSEEGSLEKLSRYTELLEKAKVKITVFHPKPSLNLPGAIKIIESLSTAHTKIKIYLQQLEQDSKNYCGFRKGFLVGRSF